MIDGYCDERFYEAKELFSKSIESGFELGAAITLEIEGETVIDLWAVSYTHLTLPTTRHV